MHDSAAPVLRSLPRRVACLSLALYGDLDLLDREQDSPKLDTTPGKVDTKVSVFSSSAQKLTVLQQRSGQHRMTMISVASRTVDYCMRTRELGSWEATSIDNAHPR